MTTLGCSGPCIPFFESSVCEYYECVTFLIELLVWPVVGVLDMYLKACFLYVGGFLEDVEIDVSKFIRLWIVQKIRKGKKQ